MEVPLEEQPEREDAMADRGVPTEETTAMTPAVIEAGLHTLGRSPHSLRYAYLGLRASGLRLTSLEALRGYVHLEDVDVHDNELTELSVLEALPYLTRLDTSHNALTTALKFRPAKCDVFNSWNAGDQWVGSVLAEVNLSHNRIESIGALYWHKYLRVLDLSHNRLTRIQGLDGLTLLEVLRLGHNQIAEIEGLSSDLPLVELGLEHNCLESVAGLEDLTQLQVLDVSHNRITSLQPLEQQQLLKRLDASGNAISDPREAEALSGLPHLLWLRLADNPVASKAFYRERVIIFTQQVRELDDVAVTHKEKVHSLNLQGQDLSHRMQTFAKHFPDRPFSNLLPPFVEANQQGPESAETGRAATQGLLGSKLQEEEL